jgi:hypothetical protein
MDVSSIESADDTNRRWGAHNRALRCGWTDLLNRWPWDLFGTHTFRGDVHLDAAARIFDRFISILNRELYGPRWYKHGDGICWVRAMERQTRGVIHFHSMLADSRLVEFYEARVQGESARRPNALNETWNSLAGYARIEPIRSQEAVTHYLTKYVAKGGEIDVGGPRFSQPRQVEPAGQVSWSSPPDQRYRNKLLGILGSVTSDVERQALRAWAEGGTSSRTPTPDLIDSVRDRVRGIRNSTTPTA